MIVPVSRPMAHRVGPLARLEHRARTAGWATAVSAARGAARVTVGSPRGIVLAVLLLIGASAASMVLGSGNHVPSALESMPAGQPAVVAPAVVSPAATVAPSAVASASAPVVASPTAVAAYPATVVPAAVVAPTSTPVVASSADAAAYQASVAASATRAASVAAAAPASIPVASPAGAMSAQASVVSAALSSVSGSAGIDPLDLIVKGIVVGALLYLTLRVLRRIQAGPVDGTHRLEILETRPLGPKASLYLVAVGERRLVVGLSPGGIVSIADIDAAELAMPAGAGDVARSLATDNAAASAAAGQGVVLLTLARAGWVAARNLLSGRTLAAVRATPPALGPTPRDTGRRGGTR